MFKLEQVYSNMTSKFSKFENIFRERRQSRPIPSSIKVEITGSVQRTVADLFDFFEVYYNDLVYWPFHEPKSKIITVYLKVQDFDSTFKKLFTARFPTARYFNMNSKTDVFNLKIGNIEDELFFFDSSSERFGGVVGRGVLCLCEGIGL